MGSKLIQFEMEERGVNAMHKTMTVGREHRFTNDIYLAKIKEAIQCTEISVIVDDLVYTAFCEVIEDARKNPHDEGTALVLSLFKVRSITDI